VTYLRFLALSATMLLLTASLATAAPGDLDDSLGGDGIVALDWGGVDFATGVLVQPDGRIVVPGSGGAGEDFIVARVGPDGSPDPSFSGNGFADFPLGTGLDEADDVARQVDGKIVAAGFTSDAADVSKGAVVRLNPDGGLDGSFATGGLATIDAGGTTNVVTKLLIQPDGKIVAAGYGGPGLDGVVTRLNSDGLPDSSFDGDGRATFDFGGTNYVDAIARQSDGKLVVLGWTSGGGMWLIRLNVDGSPDTSFDGDGRKPLPLATGDFGYDVLVQPDGKLVLIGGGVGSGFLVSRLTPDGSFDEGFADREGITAINFGASDSDFPNGGACSRPTARSSSRATPRPARPARSWWPGCSPAVRSTRPSAPTASRRCRGPRPGASGCSPTAGSSWPATTARTRLSHASTATGSKPAAALRVEGPVVAAVAAEARACPGAPASEPRSSAARARTGSRAPAAPT